MPDGNGTSPAGPAEILLVEDEPADADLCLRELARQRISQRIEWVKDGAEALDFLFTRGRYAGRAIGHPRVVLLDLKLPKIDGFEVLRQVRADHRFAAMPIIALTSSAEERDIAASYSLGVNSYLAKPVSFRSYQQAIESLGTYWMLLNRTPGAGR
jgi:two-component system response regulator